jgi:ABC-type polysaccharide/polyol phosphate transport system ATPase subunit
MYARLAFSLSTAIQPDILILDEMFAGGDVAFVQKATARMKQMVDRANIMVFVSHDLKLLRSFCNRIIWMDHGKIKRDSPGLELLEEYQRGKDGGPSMPLSKTV